MENASHRLKGKTYTKGNAYDPVRGAVRGSALAAAQWAALGILGAGLAFSLTSCARPELLDLSKPLKDGNFEGQSNPDEQGAIGTLSITVSGGKIVDSKYSTADKTGHAKDSDYGKSSDGQVGNQQFYERAQAAVKSYNQYAKELTAKGDPQKVDVVSGATVAHSQFLQAAVRAILSAQGIEDDSVVDSITVPSLELEDDAY